MLHKDMQEQRKSRSSDSHFRSWATNLVTGIADAQIDSTPMVCITGQVGKHLLGSDAFQETDIGISTPVTKWNYQITEASEIPEIMAKLLHCTIRTSRPVLVDITKMQFDEFEFSYKNVQILEVIIQNQL
jgi:acetolactate synthase-1/2/3 large subunit